MSNFKARMHQIRFQLGLRSRPRWGTYSAVFKGLNYFQGGGGEEQERRRDLPVQCQTASHTRACPIHEKGRHQTQISNNRFSIFFPWQIVYEICSKALLKIPQHLIRVATLPCKNASMSENKRRSQTTIVISLTINHKLVNYTFELWWHGSFSIWCQFVSLISCAWQFLAPNRGPIIIHEAGLVCAPSSNTRKADKTLDRLGHRIALYIQAHVRRTVNAS